MGRRRRIRQRDFLELNQELATLLKAGMPLVQSLDLLRGSLVDPVFKPVVDTVYDRVKSGVRSRTPSTSSARWCRASTPRR